ncbi:hypothetical protein C3L33_23071, partial [Rhododendron williamsianum]
METSASRSIFVCLCALMIITFTFHETSGALHAETQRQINQANKNGPYLGLVIPNLFEMNPLLQSPNFTASDLKIDFAGKFINAGITTQLLLSLFKIEGIVHYGIAGNANPSLNIGDVTIPQYWSHTGLWNWQVSALDHCLVIPTTIS